MSQVITLMYHDIYNRDVCESGFQNSTALKYKISLVEFEEQVRSISEYLKQRKLSSSTVRFTFDDGGESFLKEAAPILEKYGFRGLFFISTGYIGTKGFLDASQIKELVNRGHIVGSHSHSHPERMSAMSAEQIKDEWTISQMLLTEVLGYTPNTASIPNGYSSPAVLKAMTQANIFEIYTSCPSAKVHKHGDYTVRGRFSVTTEMNTKQVLAIVSSPCKRLMIGCRQKILNLFKILLGNYYLTIRKKLIK